MPNHHPMDDKMLDYRQDRRRRHHHHSSRCQEDCGRSDAVSILTMSSTMKMMKKMTVPSVILLSLCQVMCLSIIVQSCDAWTTTKTIAYSKPTVSTGIPTTTTMRSCSTVHTCKMMRRSRWNHRCDTTTTTNTMIRTTSTSLTLSSSSSSNGLQNNPSSPSSLPSSRSVDENNNIDSHTINAAAGGGGSSHDVVEFQDINIDDVLREAEAALNVAQTSLQTTSTIEDVSNDSDVFDDRTTTTSSTTTIPSSPISSSSSSNSLTTTEDRTKLLRDVICCTMGGTLLGLVFGSIIAIGFPQLTNSIILDWFEIPIIGSITFGMVGFVSCLLTTDESTMGGKVVRILFASPIIFLANAILTTAQRKVEQTTQEIQAFPSKVVNSVKTSVTSATQSAVEEVTSIPQRTKDQIISTGLLEPDFLLAVLVIPFLTAIIVLLLDAIVSGRDLSSIIMMILPQQLQQ